MQSEMGRLMHHDEQELLSVWEGWHWDDNKGGWLDLELCAQARREEVVAPRCTKGYQEKPTHVRRRRHRSRQDGRRLTRGNQGSPTCARGGSRRVQDALKVVLSEIATGTRSQHGEGYLSNCRPKTTSQAMNKHMCGLLPYSLCGTRDAAQNWEEELASTLSDLKLTRGIACPCVWRGCIKGEDIVTTVHGDDITIGGERSAVDFVIKMISRKYEIKKQVIGEDAEL